MLNKGERRAGAADESSPLFHCREMKKEQEREELWRKLDGLRLEHDMNAKRTGNANTAYPSGSESGTVAASDTETTAS